MKTKIIALASIALCSFALIGCDDSFSQQSARDKPNKPTPSITPVSSASPIITPTPPNLPCVPDITPCPSPTATPTPTAGSSR